MKEKNNIKMVKYPNNDLYQSRKICAFQKVQSRKYFRAEKVIWLWLLQGADLHLFQTRFVIGWENNRGGDNALIPENKKQCRLQGPMK